MNLLHRVEESDEDGYQIVSDYKNSLDERQAQRFESELIRNRNNVYCGGIVRKYDGEYPIWALLEIIPFGRLVDFYKFCSERFQDKWMTNTYYQLLTCKEIRNACAHSNWYV